jgi:hypothetical protein
MVLSARSALEAKSELIDIRAGRFLSPIPEITRSPMEFDEFDQARSVPPPPAVRDRQPLRHALRGPATSSILSWSCGNRVCADADGTPDAVP